MRLFVIKVLIELIVLLNEATLYACVRAGVNIHTKPFAWFVRAWLWIGTIHTTENLIVLLGKPLNLLLEKDGF